MSDSTLTIGRTHGGNYGKKLGVEFDLRDALAVKRNLGAVAKFLPDIQARAIRAMARGITTFAKRDIVKEYNIGANRVGKDLRASVLTGLRGVRLTGYFRGIGLIQFGATAYMAGKPGGGVKYRIFRGGVVNQAPGEFIATLLRGKTDTGNVHVAYRTGEFALMENGRYAGKIREKIAVEYGPTVAQMLRKGDRPERIADAAVGLVQKEIQRQLAYFERSLTAPVDNLSTEPLA